MCNQPVQSAQRGRQHGVCERASGSALHFEAAQGGTLFFQCSQRIRAFFRVDTLVVEAKNQVRQRLPRKVYPLGEL